MTVPRRDRIVIGDYDPLWPERFEEQRFSVARVLRPWLARDVEHIGSTAVPGLSAKNIVDMLAVVAGIDAVRGAMQLMTGIGWLHAPEPADDAERRLSFCFPSVERRSHHLHIVEERSGKWRGWLAFRDELRAHPDLARDYAELKTRLATAYGNDPNRRDEYRQGKASFILAVTARALGDGDGSA